MNPGVIVIVIYSHIHVYHRGFLFFFLLIGSLATDRADYIPLGFHGAEADAALRFFMVLHRTTTAPSDIRKRLLRKIKTAISDISELKRLI